MEVSFTPDLEDKLFRLASTQGRETAALVVEAVERLVDYDAWFVTEVDKGLAQIEAGQTLSHEEVGSRLQKHLAAKLSPARCNCDGRKMLPRTSKESRIICSKKHRSMLIE